MPATAWGVLIPVGCGIVGGTVVLANGYMNRKQARQIELHRVDPRAPLDPPPSAATRFLKTYGLLIVIGLVDIAALTAELRSREPVTRTAVLLISLDVASILFLALMAMLIRIMGLIERVVGTVERIIDFLHAHSGNRRSAGAGGDPSGSG